MKKEEEEEEEKCKKGCIRWISYHMYEIHRMLGARGWFESPPCPPVGGGKRVHRFEDGSGRGRADECASTSIDQRVCTSSQGHDITSSYRMYIPLPAKNIKRRREATRESVFEEDIVQEEGRERSHFHGGGGGSRGEGGHTIVGRRMEANPELLEGGEEGLKPTHEKGEDTYNNNNNVEDGGGSSSSILNLGREGMVGKLRKKGRLVAWRDRWTVKD